jgi:hypothetical protein
VLVVVVLGSVALPAGAKVLARSVRIAFDHAATANAPLTSAPTPASQPAPVTSRVVSKDGCTLTVTSPVEVVTPAYDFGFATMSVRCNTTHKNTHLAIQVQKHVPDVWVGLTEMKTTTLTARRSSVLAGHELCVPGAMDAFRARARVTFQARIAGHQRTVTIVTPFSASTTLPCG